MRLHGHKLCIYKRRSYMSDPICADSQTVFILLNIVTEEKFKARFELDRFLCSTIHCFLYKKDRCIFWKGKRFLWSRTHSSPGLEQAFRNPAQLGGQSNGYISF